MNDFSLYILDLVENSLAAGASEIAVTLATVKDKKCLVICDNGRGVANVDTQLLLSPFYTTRTTRRVGLGLSLLDHLSKLCAGWVRIVPLRPRGAAVIGVFQARHWDLPPDGDLASTALVLISVNRHCRFLFRYGNCDGMVSIDSRDLDEMGYLELKDYLGKAFTCWEGFGNEKNQIVS